MRLYSTSVRAQRSVLAALLGAAACYGVLVMTEPPGPGLDPDSMSYLGAAESLLRHGTLRIPAGHWSEADSTSPLGHFPPGFPLAIVVPTALGAPIVQAARGLEAAAAFATVALAVWLVGAAAGAAPGAAAGLLLLASPSLAFDHWQVISEPLCLALLMATLALMTFSSRPLLYGTAAALAGMVRYAGVSATGAVALWALGRGGTLAERTRRAAVAVAPSVILHALWVLRTEAESGEVRRFGLRGGLGPTFRQLVETVGAWLAPAVPPSWEQGVIAFVVGTAAAVLLLRSIRARSSEGEAAAPGGAPPRQLQRASLLLAACYAALVLFSRLFVDEGIPFDERLLSPFIMLVEVAAAAGLAATWSGWRPGARAAAAGVGVLWLAASGWATVRAVRDATDGGWGYASDEWRGSQLGQWLRTSAPRGPIYSNNSPAAYFLTDRPSRDLPDSLDPDSVRAFGRLLVTRGGVLVRFPFDFEPVAAPDSIAARLALPLLAAFPEGAVWGAPGER
jgi:hypothetical protein